MLAAVGALGASAFQSFGGVDGIKSLFGGDDPIGCGNPVSYADVERIFANPHALAELRRQTPTIYKKASTAARATSSISEVMRHANSPSDECTDDDRKFNRLVHSIAGNPYAGTATATISQQMPATSGVSPQPSGLSRIGDALGQVAENWGQVAANTVEGALGGAQAASGAAARGSSISLSNPFVLLAVGAGVILLLRR